MILAVDNGSSYTPALVEYLRRTGIPCNIRPFDDIGDIEGYTHYILSGRRRNDMRMNRSNAAVIRHALGHNKPLLGICYGAELLALVSGGTIRRMASPAKGPESVTVMRENPLCSGDVDVYESHAYEISSLPQPLSRLASSASCRTEIIRYGDLHVYGTQFHPEMTEGGRDILSRFLEV